MMIAAMARAMNASITRARRSVQMASFLKPWLCHELVRSTTQRAPAWRGEALHTDQGLAADLVDKIAGDRAVVVGIEMDRDLIGQTDAEPVL